MADHEPEGIEKWNILKPGSIPNFSQDSGAGAYGPLVYATYLNKIEAWHQHF